MGFFRFHCGASLIAVAALILIPTVGSAIGMDVLFGVVVPYLALLVFLGGMIYRIVQWARSPVPFRITTTCGQQKTLGWLRQSMRDKIENPSNGFWAAVRLVIEVLLFRSLFRNLRPELRANAEGDGDKRLIFWSSYWLWLGALVFHYAFLTVIVRHLWLFTEPVPVFVQILQGIDSFFRLYVPAVYMSGLALLAAAAYLLARRLFDSRLRYISLFTDYFPLFLILSIASTGVLMRYVWKVDVEAVKEVTMGLATLHPTMPDAEIGALFYVHLFLVCCLLAYFPFSKLAHFAGILFSPTRNVANSNRAVRHVNPWNYPVKIKTYLDQENEYREQMAKAGLPLEISPEEAEALGQDELEKRAKEQENLFSPTSGKRDAPVFPETASLRGNEEVEH